MSAVFLPEIKKKLTEKHSVSVSEVEEAFLNRDRHLLEDQRLKNKGDNPRYWFISKTDKDRELKVVYVVDPDFTEPVVITAYEPSSEEKRIYEKYAKPLG